MADAPPGRRGRGARRRPAAVPLPLRRRVSERPGRRVSERRRPDAARASPRERRRRGSKGRRRAQAGVAGDRSASTRCSTCSPPTRGAGSTAPTRPASRDLVPGAEALVLVAVRSAKKRVSCATAARWSRPWSATAPGGCTSCSSTSRGGSASWSPGLQVALFGKVDTYRGGLQMTNPVVDLIGDRTGRIVPIYPQSEKAQLQHVGDRRLGRERVASVRHSGGSPTRCRPPIRRRLGPDRPGHRRCTTSTCPRRSPTSSRPAAGWRSTSCCACSWCS